MANRGLSHRGNHGQKFLTFEGNLSFPNPYNVTFNTSAASSVTLPTSGTLATKTGTETFTNKTLTAPVLTTPVLSTATPASAAAAGVAGTVVWDASFVYVCVATNTWKRVAIATW